MYPVQKYHSSYIDYTDVTHLAKNSAHPVVYENGNKTRNWYIDVQLFSRTKMKAFGCLVPELQTEKHLRHGTQFF